MFQNLISLSIILLLLTAMGSIIYFSIETSREIKGDLELTRELSYVMERITEDANLADKVTILKLPDGDRIEVFYTTKPKTNDSDKLIRIYYQKIIPINQGQSKIIVDAPTSPLTGDSELGQVHITKFETKKISEHLFTVELTGISMVTNHAYTLKSAIYTQGEITE